MWHLLMLLQETLQRLAPVVIRDQPSWREYVREREKSGCCYVCEKELRGMMATVLRYRHDPRKETRLCSPICANIIVKKGGTLQTTEAPYPNYLTLDASPQASLSMDDWIAMQAGLSMNPTLFVPPTGTREEYWASNTWVEQYQSALRIFQTLEESREIFMRAPNT